MADIGSLFIRLVADATPMQRALGSAKNSLRQWTREAEKTGNVAEQALARALPASRMMLGTTVKLAAAGAAAMTGVGFLAVRAAANLEQTQIAFETLLGSAQEADSFIREMQQFAARTPFEFKGLAQSARQLLAFKFQAQDVLPVMRAVGDAAAAMGGGQEMIDRIVRALGQMQAKGRAQGEELLQLAESGVNAYQYLADAMGTSIPQVMKMMSRGAVDSRTAIKAILAGMQHDFAGAMEKQSRTILGQWSTLKDNLGLILTGIGKDIIRAFNIGGVLQAGNQRLSEFAALVSQAGWARAWAELAPPWVTAVLVAIAGAIAGALTPALFALGKTLWGVGRVLWTSMAPLLPWMAIGAALAVAVWALARHWQAAWSAIGAVTLMGASYVARAVALALSSLAAFVPALQGMARTATALADSLAGSASQLWATARSGFQAARSAQQVQNTQAGIAKAGNKAAESQNQLAKGMENAAKAAADNIQSFDEVHQIQEQMADTAASGVGGITLPEIATPTLPSIGGLAADAGQKAASAWHNALDGIAKGWERLKAAALDAFPWIANVIDGVSRAVQWARDNWDSIRPILEGVAGALLIVGAAWLIATNPIAAFVAGGLLVAALAGTIIANWGQLEPVLGPIWQRIWAVIGPIWTTIRDTAAMVFNSVYQTAVFAWSRLSDWWANWGGVVVAILNGIWNQIGIIVDTALKLIGNTLAVALALIRGDWQAAWEDIKGIGEAIWGLIAQTWQNLLRTAGEVWQAIAQTLINRWEQTKAGAVEIWTSIGNWLSSTWDSIKTWASDRFGSIVATITGLWDRVKTATTNAWDGIKNWLSNTWQGLIQSAGNFGRNMMESLKNAIGSVRLPIPSIQIEFTSGPMGIPIPRLDWGVNWRALRDLVPWLAEGGIIDRPTLVGVGERGPEAVVPLSRDNVLADSIAQAVYQAVVDANRITQATQQPADREVVLRIDGATFARLVLPAVIKEGQRQGLQLVVRPQGV